MGPTMTIQYNGLHLQLVAPKKEWLPLYIERRNHLSVRQFGAPLRAETIGMADEWLARMEKSRDEFVWMILPEGEDVPIGATELEQVYRNQCWSGIMIWNKDWWGKGVAKTTHLARTMFAADFLNMWTIRSSVVSTNTASWKALESVGYVQVGTNYAETFVQGRYHSAFRYQWFHPEHLEELVCDQSITEAMGDAQQKAVNALETARKVVEY